MKKLKHKHVIEYYGQDYNKKKQEMYIFMQYARNGDLRNIIMNDKKKIFFNKLKENEDD